MRLEAAHRQVIVEDVTRPTRFLLGLAGATLGIGLVAGVAWSRLGPAPLGAEGGSGLDVLAVFGVAMLIGVAGAMVFLIVQLLTESDAGLMRRLTASRYGVPPGAMTAMFLLSGGLVAGFSQATIGSFQAANIWTTFLIGFGWQGVIAGVGGSAAGAAAVRETVAEGERLAQATALATAREFQPVVEGLKNQVKELEKQLSLAERGLPPPDGEALGQVLGPGAGTEGGA